VFRPNIPTNEPEKRPKGDIETEDAEQPKMATSKVPDTSEPRIKPAAEPVTLENWGLRDFGVAIPPGASIVEVDGVALPVRNPSELAGQAGVPLVLPYGKHVVRFAKTNPPRVIEPKRWFLDAYREAATQVHENGRWSFDRLLELSRRSLDRFTEPLVPHLWGNFYWQEDQHDAAVRHYAWALEIAPTFAPSYFNLAQLSHERGDDDAARRYLRLADLWNAQNAYGLSNALNGLRTSLGSGEESADEDQPDWFVADHGSLTSRDQDMIAVLRSAAEFAPRPTERAKILNNLGAYFEHIGKPELALESYRTAASVLGAAKLENEERRVIQGILENLARVCRKADMPEYRRYERLQAMVER
jgi:tetratricopeptide (TPR) repeat protein